MTREEAVGYLNSRTTNITNTDVIFIRNLIHYKHSVLVDTEKIVQGIHMRAAIGDLNRILSNMVDFVMLEFNIIVVFNQLNQIIRYV